MITHCFSSPGRKAAGARGRRRPTPGILALLLAAAVVQPGRAQVSPLVSAVAGIGSVRTDLRSARMLTFGANVGVTLGSRWLFDAGIQAMRDNVEYDGTKNLLIATAGPGLRFGSTNRDYLRLGLGIARGTQQKSCLDVITFCPPDVIHWRPALGASLGTAAKLGSVRIGPEVWWSQSLGGEPRYRALGVGLRIGIATGRRS